MRSRTCPTTRCRRSRDPPHLTVRQLWCAPMGSMRRTVAELVQERWNDHRPGLWFEGRVLSHHRVAAGAAARAALLADLLPPRAEPPHLGVLLDNTPEYPMWLSAAALAGAAVAGINPTRRGPELARDILHTECRVLITEQAHLPLLDGLELPGVRVLVTDTDAYADLLTPYEGTKPDASSASPRTACSSTSPPARPAPPRPRSAPRAGSPPRGSRSSTTSACGGRTRTTSACRCSTATR